MELVTGSELGQYSTLALKTEFGSLSIQPAPSYSARNAQAIRTKGTQPASNKGTHLC